MATTQADFTATTTWQDLVASNGATASVDVSLFNKGDNPVRVVWGGTIPTTEDAGETIAPGTRMIASGAAIWLKSIAGTDKVGVLIL